MGRKSKLKNDKRRAAAAARMNNNNNQEVLATESAADVNAITIATANETAPATATAHATVDAASTSVTGTEVVQLLVNGNINEAINRCMHGATENGCVHSMNMLGEIHNNPKSNGKFIHLAVPWFLEAAIRGSVKANELLNIGIYFDYLVDPFVPTALNKYWQKMAMKCVQWDRGRSAITTIDKNEMSDDINRECVICFKTDTATLTLRQCIGCSTYCYCSEDCQHFHWNKLNHRNECKQVQILNKYHKPYAKEIRKASIRGENHPALEKLRHKLGLSRPIEDYQELVDTNTYEGKPIDPCKYVVAREDGTVWIGSIPAPIGPFSDNSITAFITDVMSMKVSAMKNELTSYGICTDTFIEKSEFVDALQKARNDTDRKPKSTVTL